MEFNVKVRQKIERLIAEAAVKQLLAAGFLLGVNDGEDITISHSCDAAKILAAMFTTDEDYLYVYLDSDPDFTYWVRFVYGNDGWDVISDYNVALEEHLTEANALADQIEEGDFAIVPNTHIAQVPKPSRFDSEVKSIGRA
jgi:hypothetical protein